MEVIRDADNGRYVPSSNLNGRIVEFDLPKAMRICRTPGARYMLSMSNYVASLTICASRRINILYNAQAFHLDSNTSTPVPPSPQEQDPAVSVLTGVGLILSPLRFDSQASSLSFSPGAPLTDEGCCRPCIALLRLSVL